MEEDDEVMPSQDETIKMENHVQVRKEKFVI